MASSIPSFHSLSGSFEESSSSFLSEKGVMKIDAGRAFPSSSPVLSSPISPYLRASSRSYGSIQSVGKPYLEKDPVLDEIFLKVEAAKLTSSFEESMQLFDVQVEMRRIKTIIPFSEADLKTSGELFFSRLFEICSFAFGSLIDRIGLDKEKLVLGIRKDGSDVRFICRDHLIEGPEIWSKSPYFASDFSEKQESIRSVMRSRGVSEEVIEDIGDLIPDPSIYNSVVGIRHIASSSIPDSAAGSTADSRLGERQRGMRVLQEIKSTLIEEKKDATRQAFEELVETLKGCDPKPDRFLVTISLSKKSG